MEKILITGASGFINANLTRRMVAEGYEVGVLLRKQSKLDRLKDILPNVRAIYADLTDYASIDREVHDFRPDHIFHSATYGAYPDEQNDEDLMIQTNVTGTYHLLKATQDIPYKSFIYAGSSSEYGVKDRAMSESDRLDPLSFYGVTKASATLLSRMFAKKFRKNIVILRLFSVYGPFEKSTRFIPYVISRCLDGKPVEMTSGEQRRDFVYIDDVMDAYLHVMKKEGLAGEIFNVGCGEDVSIREAAETIFDLTGSDRRLLKIGAKPQRTSEVVHTWKADLSKLKDKLGFHPQVPLREGLKRMIEWTRQNQEHHAHV